MLALYRSGRQAEALEAYRDARAALDELGIEPSAELRELEKQILTQDAALDAGASGRRTCPSKPTPLVGREHELADVLELVRANRLVTLTGAGGSGRRDLRCRRPRELVGDFADGVWFVSLASLSDPELVEPTIAQVLGARGELNDFLRGKHLLLLLDNLEQLLPDVATDRGGARGEGARDQPRASQRHAPSMSIRCRRSRLTTRSRCSRSGRDKLKPRFAPGRARRRDRRGGSTASRSRSNSPPRA